MTKEKKIYIYGLRCPLSNEIRYVGKTNNLKQRFQDHLRDGRDESRHKRNWINKLKTLNLKPIMEILDTVLEAEWKKSEKFFIKKYRDSKNKLVNYTDGGDGLSFGNQTSFKKGQVPWNKGKSGYNVDRSNYQHTGKTKRKISVKLKGRLNNGNSKPVLQINKVTGKIIQEYPSAAEAGRQTNIHLLGALYGSRKTAGGYRWEQKICH